MEYENWFWWIQCVENPAVASFTCLVVAVHSINVTSDLFTTTRTSLSHRTSLPQINLKYKLVTCFTWISVVLFSLELIGEISVSYQFTYAYCKFIVTMLAEIYFYAKFFMYMVFLLRLDMSFGETNFAYKRTHMLFITILLVVITLILSISHPLTVIIDIFVYESISDGDLAIICAPTYNIFVISSAVLLDIFASSGFIIAFLYPLVKSIMAIKQCADDKMDASHNLIKIGIKTTILTVLASVSTLFMLIILSMSKIGYIVGKFDLIINALCMILMTPYYPDSKYYTKICWLPIWCCSICGIDDKIVSTLTVTSDSVQLTVQGDD